MATGYSRLGCVPRSCSESALIRTMKFMSKCDQTRRQQSSFPESPYPPVFSHFAILSRARLCSPWFARVLSYTLKSSVQTLVTLSRLRLFIYWKCDLGDVIIVIIERYAGHWFYGRYAHRKKIEMDVFTRVMAETEVRSHYYIVPYYNSRPGIERVKWQKIRRTWEETWSMGGSLRSIIAI